MSVKKSKSAKINETQSIKDRYKATHPVGYFYKGVRRQDLGDFEDKKEESLSSTSVICVKDEDFGACGETTRLTIKQYREQLNDPNKGWRCPNCKVFPCAISIDED